MANRCIRDYARQRRRNQGTDHLGCFKKTEQKKPVRQNRTHNSAVIVDTRTLHKDTETNKGLNKEQ